MTDMGEHEPGDDREWQAPEAFTNALQQLEKERVFIPPSVDERILARAQEQIRRAARRQRRRQVATRVLALAACIAFLAWIAATNIFRPGRQQANSGRNLPEDVNGDGRVDILDAFELARVIERGNPLPSKADLNGDGRVDSADVEIIARHSVSIEKGGRS